MYNFYLENLFRFSFLQHFATGTTVSQQIKNMSPWMWISQETEKAQRKKGNRKCCLLLAQYEHMSNSGCVCMRLIYYAVKHHCLHMHTICCAVNLSTAHLATTCKYR